MKKILISPDFLYQISLYLLLPNLATTKFLILKQAKKLVMRMSTRKLAPGNRNIVGARVTEARSTGTPGIWHRTQGAGRNSECRCPLAARPDLKSPKRKIHIIAVNPLKLSAGPCFSQKVIWDEKCLCFEKIERQLPERVPYQLWYILNNYTCFHGEQQQCLRIIQRKLPSELVMSFLAEQPVSARIVIRRQGERVVIMLAEEKAELEWDSNWLAITLVP